MAAHVCAYTLTSAMGVGLAELRTSLSDGRSGLTNAPWPDCDVPCALGRIPELDQVVVPPERESRNNRLVRLAAEQDGFDAAVADARARYGAHRIGLVMGTSTSSIDRTEAAYTRLMDDHFQAADRQPLTHQPHAPGDYAAELFEVTGPCVTVSAACASSAKVFATASRWLSQGWVDAVIVGGADTLCLSVIYGFNSLQLVSPEACRPFDADRSGISLGEAAGFALLTRDADAVAELRGTGESCDAHHMSSAHPEGLGARLAMERALADAQMTFADLDYLNLHGTGTRANDDTEGRVCAQLLNDHTRASATKGWTGHALGAAGIVEAVLCLEALTQGVLPGTRNTRNAEADFNLLLESQEAQIRTAMTNSFGFGGNNCSVVFSS